MFNIFKKKESKIEKIYSPFKGSLVNLEDVPDVVFAQKMMGDGVAIIPSEGKLYSPVEGEIVSIFDAKHALMINSIDGTNILIHIGLETMSLEGKPFDVKVKAGDKVKAKDLIMEVDLDLIISNDLNVITPVVIINDADAVKRTVKERLEPIEVDTNSIIMEVE
ncbi:PTS glucose transporter subunit IIA [Clostridioides sp. ES-S-0001-02]|uniref:PTS sugar transporter subunit IIA n=1 Tax=Clostridioides sp. ES-S-0001-02 TaxID=2770770 RepID=UPI001D0F629C|nr:PTS glucose transporter subunit IIA [Clostridioides sp. ES-S-0001-02]